MTMTIRSVLLALAVGFVVPLMAEETVGDKAVFPTKPGMYANGLWKYQYRIENAGTPSEVRSGKLWFKGIAIPGSPGEIKDTPVGKFQFLAGDGEKGWLNTGRGDRQVVKEGGEGGSD